jgi:hypothetical protein
LPPLGHKSHRLAYSNLLSAAFGSGHRKPEQAQAGEQERNTGQHRESLTPDVLRKMRAALEGDESALKLSSLITDLGRWSYQPIEFQGQCFLALILREL